MSWGIKCTLLDKVLTEGHWAAMWGEPRHASRGSQATHCFVPGSDPCSPHWIWLLPVALHEHSLLTSPMLAKTGEGAQEDLGDRFKDCLVVSANHRPGQG